MMTAKELNDFCKDCMIGHLGIEFTELSEGLLKARMPVDQRTIQPMKLLHGGAGIALAESLGSAGSYALVDPKKYNVVGMQLSANHLASVSSGYVTGQAILLHRGSKSHVWDITITDEDNRILSVCRLTNMIVQKQSH